MHEIKQKTKKGLLVTCLLISLALKIAIMPVTLHKDLVFINYYPNLSASRGIFDIYQYLGQKDPVKMNTIAAYYPPGTLLFFTLVHLPVRLLSDNFSQWLDAIQQSARNLSNFSQLENFRNIFLMKTPYLRKKWLIL